MADYWSVEKTTAVFEHARVVGAAAAAQVRQAMDERLVKA